MEVQNGVVFRLMKWTTSIGQVVHSRGDPRLYVCQAPCPFWVHFGSILGPFWVHCGSIVGPFWVHFGSILGRFWVQFGSILGPFLGPFAYCLSGDASFNRYLNKNRYLDKNQCLDKNTF